jgi:hypothetical protein
MDHSLVSLLIHRIGSGKFYFTHKDCEYVFLQPSSDIKYRAELIYQNYIEENKYNYNWYKENITKLLIYLSLWNDSDQKYLDELEKKIENIKLDMYLSKLNKDKIKKYKSELSKTKESINKLLNTKHCLDYLTIEDAASNAKNEFTMINSIHFNNNNLDRVFSKNISDISYSHFNEIALHVGSNLISIEDYKNVARSEQWKAIWNSNKNNLFNKSAYDLSDEQKTLISISNMYDRIYEHPECPGDDVINDDDILDGWMIYQRNKADKIKKQNSAQELANKHKNAKEIFVVADKEDVNDILDLNSSVSSSIIKQRRGLIRNSKEGVDEVNLPDVQMELLQKINKR